MVVYVVGTEERDPSKQNMAIQQVGALATTNASAITTLQTNDATQVVGPGSATANGFAVYNGTTGKLVKDHAATIALASEVSGTLPVANGGTNYTGGAWTTFTPAVTAQTGTFTTVSAAGSYLAIGKLVNFIVSVTITTVGTAAGNCIVQLPLGTALRTFVTAGVETSATGFTLNSYCVAGTSNLNIRKYDVTTMNASGNVLTVAGFYEQS